MATIRFENGTYRTAGELPPIGSKAPDLSLVNTKLQDVSLANWKDMRKIINIVISVDTVVCAKSVIEFDRYGKAIEDLAILMVSYDLPFAHRRFHEQHELANSVGLSAIRHAGFGENYGVQIMDGPLAGMFARAVVALDENNTVVHREQLEDMGSEPNYTAALRSLGISIQD